jgi:hypothetical protein
MIPCPHLTITYLEKEKKWLEECRKSIELSLGWGNSTQWGNDDFERLSEKIWEKTRIRLSVSTLKRIWGRVRYNNFPNSVTLNALVGFLNYDHWRDFCQTHPIKGENNRIGPQLTQNPPGLGVPDKKNRVSRAAWYRSITWTLIVVLLILGIGSWLLHKSKTRTQSIDAANFSFSSRKVTDDLPNSVVFNYAANSPKDSKLMIQQSWDSSRRETIDAHGNQHTSIYYYPGYFIAKLLVNDRIVKETPVFIKTKGWKAIIGKKPLPIYLNDDEIRHGIGISISDTLLKEKLNTSDFNRLRVRLANIREFPGINASDFILETAFRNTSTVEESLCRRVEIEIIGTENIILIPFSTTGCIAELNLFTGDTLLLGKEHDLSAFGCDFSSLQEFKCTVNNQLLKIYLNKQPILTASQQKSLGRIVGIRIMFEGAGQVQQVAVETPNKIAYDLMK